MALPTASDNPFPSLLITETAAASISSPAAGKQRLFVDTDHVLKYKNSGGTVSNVGSGGSGDVATDAIWDAAGDLAVGTGADTAARVAIGASGKVLTSNGTTAAWAYPPGYEFGYDQITSTVNITSTTESSGTTLISCASHAFDGAAVLLHVFFPALQTGSGTVANVTVSLFEGATQIGRLGYQQLGGSNLYVPCTLFHRFTPSAASHTYTITAIRGVTDGGVIAGAGGTGTLLPAFARFTKV